MRNFEFSISKKEKKIFATYSHGLCRTIRQIYGKKHYVVLSKRKFVPCGRKKKGSEVEQNLIPNVSVHI